MGRKIFISYARENSADAQQLADLLKERDYAVWLDQLIKGGDEWEDALKQALDWATDVIVILTPASAESKWVNFEATTAKAKEDTAVHPVIIQSFDVEAYPIWARGIQHHDFYTKEYLTALAELCAALGKPDPVQELLDDREKAYNKAKALLSEDDLRLIDNNRKELLISKTADVLIRESRDHLERLRKTLYLRVLAGAIGGGLWLAFFFFLTISLNQDYKSLEFYIMLLASMLPGGGAGAWFVFSTIMSLKTIPERAFYKRLLRCGILAARSFGLMFVVYGLFISPFSNLKVYLYQGLEGALWGLIVGMGVFWASYSDVSSKVTLPITLILCAVSFWGLDAWIQSLGNGAVTWKLLLTGALLPILMILALLLESPRRE